MKRRLPSLEQLVRHRIQSRVFAAMATLVFAAVVFTIGEAVLSYTKLQGDLEKRALSLQDTIISEVLTKNYVAIPHLIDEMNESYPEEHVRWIPPSELLPEGLKSGLSWHFPCNWVFIRRLDKMGEHFGSFVFDGSFLTSGNFMLNLGRRVAFAAILSLVIGNLLFPIAKRTPNDLILEPVHDLIDLLRTDPNQVSKVSHARYQELKVIEDDVKNMMIEKLQHDRERLEAEQMLTITKAAQHLAHDLQRPFAVITGVLDTLPMARTIDEMHELLKDSVPGVKRAFTHLDHMLEELKTLGNPNPSVKKRISVKEFVETGIEHALADRKRTKNQIIVEVASELTVFGNTSQLSRVIANLISNALQVIGAADTISVSAKLVAGAEIEMAVKNTGSFIPEAERQKIFECFYTKGNHRGSGIGLAICKKIMKEHDGNITASSSEFNGEKLTEFVLTFPNDRAFERKIRQTPASPRALNG